MMRGAVTIAALLALAACQDGAPSFDTVSISLPDDGGSFPDGPGVEAITANCTACHSPSMILNQPALTRDQWQSSINKMREVYKATVDPAAEGAILDYLEARGAGSWQWQLCL
jgi:hypothetical protein